MRTKELHSIRGELSQIKAQVDCLLESLERMHQQREQHPGQAPPRVGPGHALSGLQLFLLLRVPGALRVLDLLFLSAGLLPASWSALPPRPPRPPTPRLFLWLENPCGFWVVLSPLPTQQLAGTSKPSH